MSQQNLLHFLGGNAKKRPREDILVNQTESKSKARRKFRLEWLNEYEWLSYNSESDLMFCFLCLNAKKKNPFGTSGSSNFQKSALDRHGNTNPDHLQLIQAKNMQTSKTTVTCMLERNEQQNTSLCHESKITQMKTMYFVAKSGLPLSTQNSLIELQRENGCPSLQDQKLSYTSAQSHDDMLDAINQTIEDNVNEDLHSSDFVGIIVDETTDITVHKKLNIYFRCFKSGTCEPIIRYVDCVSVENGKAETIVNEIVRVCERIGLDWMKVISMASDGASVMTGKKGGVGVKLREGHNPRLIQVHCVAHRLALCASQACKDNLCFTEYQNAVKTLYRFFHNSAVRYNGLREMENILYDENSDTKHVTLKEPSSFRWLSLEGAINAVYRCYPALILTLENEASKGVSEAKGILKSVRNVSFLFKTAFLMDVLGVVNKLCKIFQKDQLDIDMVDIMVKCTIDTLDALKNENGATLQKVYADLETDLYKDLKLIDNHNIRIAFQNTSQAYLDSLINNMTARFDSDSVTKLSLANRIINPKFLPLTNNAIATYGKDELEQVVNWLGPIADKAGLVDSSRMSDDYLPFKMILKNFRGKPLSDVCKTIINEYSDMFIDYCVVAKILLVCPLTSVACERGFSSQNRLKTKSRWRLEHEKLSKLIRIVEEGPSISQFNMTNALENFEKMKKRRK